MAAQHAQSSQVEKQQEVDHIEKDVELPREVHLHAKTIIAVAAVCFLFFAQLIAVVGSGLIARPTAILLGDSSVSVWYSTIITIIGLALVPPFSQAADFWGRKWIILISSFGGIIGPIVISRAQDNATAIVGFCFLAVAFGCQSICYAIPSEVLHRKQRAIGQAAVNISSGTGAIVGVLMGGTLLRNDYAENYRIYWYVTAGIYALGCVGILIGYNPPPRELQKSLSTVEKLRRLDWIGIGMISVGLSLFAIALQWSGNPYSWADAPVVAPFVIGVVLLIGFGVYEWRGRSDGILHHSLFRDRNFPLAIITVFVEGLVFFTTNNFLVYEVSLVYSLNLFDAGLRFVLQFVVSIVFAFAVGAYTTKTKRIREPMIVGYVLLVIYNALLASMKSNTPAANSYGYALFGGAGIGFILTTVMIAAQMSTPADMISVTSGLVTAARSLGGAVGLAVNNAVFSNTLSSNLGKNVAAAVLPLGFPETELGELISALAADDQQAIAKIPGITSQIIGAAVPATIDSFTLSFRNAWITATCFSVIGVIAVCFIRNPKSEFNAHIDAPAEASLVKIQAEIEAMDVEVKRRDSSE